MNLFLSPCNVVKKKDSYLIIRLAFGAQSKSSKLNFLRRILCVGRLRRPEERISNAGK